jgi:iron-sulfur cluster insertion protein
MSESALQVETVGLDLHMTDAAIDKVRRLIAAEGKDTLLLRIYVTGGGCSGFQYGFAFEEAAAEDDTRIEQGAVTLLVDPMSYPYLTGAQVDYVEDLRGSQFVVSNPNASTTCGCGSSFSI